MPCPHNNISCPCLKDCPRHGKCCECVLHHRAHGKKLPVCLRGIEWEKGAGNSIALEGKKKKNGRKERAMVLPWNGRSRRLGEMGGQWHCPRREEEGNKQNETQKGE